MSKSLAEIRRNAGVENLSKSCNRDGCRAYMNGIPQRKVIVDADRAFPAHGRTEKRCDFILFLENIDGTLVAVPIELKSGGIDELQAFEQLEEGTTFAEEVIPDTSRSVCCPVLFHGKPLHPLQRRRLNRSKVIFRGKKVGIETAPCNRKSNLANVLKEHID